MEVIVADANVFVYLYLCNLLERFLSLANCYSDGIGCDKRLDPKWANEQPRQYPILQKLNSDELKILEQKAKAGNNPIAQHELSYCYVNGINLVLLPDPKQAFKYAELSAEQGYPLGQLLLGDLYNGGICVARNTDLAKVLYRLAADQNCEEAMKCLATMEVNPNQAGLSSAGTVIAAMSYPVTNGVKAHNEIAQLHAQTAVQQSGSLLQEMRNSLQEMQNSYSRLFNTVCGIQVSVSNLLSKHAEENASLKQDLHTTKKELSSLIQRLQPILNPTFTTVTNGSGGSPALTAPVTVAIPNTETASASASASASSHQTDSISNHPNRINGTQVNKDLRRFGSVKTADSVEQKKSSENGYKKPKHS